MTRMIHNLKSIQLRNKKGETQAGLCWKEFFIIDDMSKKYSIYGRISTF